MRRFFVPEVVQTSVLDCGPAALHSLLAGFDIPSTYGRLREACQTGLDGTSIDTLELVANAAGLKAEQVLLPFDYVFLPESKALPAIVVVTLLDGLTHFVVVWRRHGAFLQIMDPAVGRRWVRIAEFKRQLYNHQLTVPAESWREFARTEDFCASLAARLAQCGMDRATASKLIGEAVTDDHWRKPAALDAACRALAAIQQAQGSRRASDAERVVRKLCEYPEAIPSQFWSVQAANEDTLLMRGAVLVRATGKRAGQTDEQTTTEFPHVVLHTPSASAFVQVYRHLRTHGLLTPLWLLLNGAGVAAGMLIEALLFRGLFDFSSELHLPWQRMAAVLALASFSFVVLLLDLLVFRGTTRICRRLESAFRVAFLRKVPRLPDRYFASRLQSDMGERSHALHRLRYLPDIVHRLIASLFELMLTAAGIAILEPATAPFVILAVAAATLPALFNRSFLNERDLRVKTHGAALTRFYLDAALGLSSIRAHGAENNLRRAHSRRLSDWIAAALEMQRTVVMVEAVQTTAMFAAIALLFLMHPVSGAEVGRLLLLAYWALSLPVSGQTFGALVRQLPGLRSLILRASEPIEAEEEQVDDLRPAWTKAPAISFLGVTAKASGHTILENVSIEIPAGSHVAVVGQSGAGKSSLVGSLLGWLRPQEGTILVNGSPMKPGEIRRATAWVDPAVQLWNRSLYENVIFGTEVTAQRAGAAVEAAHLRSVLQDLPEGLQTTLGEGGGRLSGGEGQRVRLARAILRTDALLVLLDEPFRGLDRELREQLLAEARHRWSQSTLLCVTHDLAETRSFDYVLVLDGGQIVEQGTPDELFRCEGGRYRVMIDAEEKLRSGVWHPRHWRRVKIKSGTIAEDQPQRRALQTLGEAEDVA